MFAGAGYNNVFGDHSVKISDVGRLRLKHLHGCYRTLFRQVFVVLIPGGLNGFGHFYPVKRFEQAGAF